MLDDVRYAHAAPLPVESGIAFLFAGADLADSFAIALPNGSTRDIMTLSRCVLGHPAPWVSILLSLRDAIVRPFGVKTSGELRSASRQPSEDRIDFFRVHAVSESEVILGEDDKHLDFRASILLRSAAPDRPAELVATTVVHCHNLFGRAYLAVILPFHRLIVRSSLDRAARRGWPS